MPRPSTRNWWDRLQPAPQVYARSTDGRMNLLFKILAKQESIDSGNDSNLEEIRTIGSYGTHLHLKIVFKECDFVRLWLHLRTHIWKSKHTRVLCWGESNQKEKGFWRLHVHDHAVLILSSRFLLSVCRTMFLCRRPPATPPLVDGDHRQFHNGDCVCCVKDRPVHTSCTPLLKYFHRPMCKMS